MHIALEEGFDGEDIVIRVDGEQVFHGEDVRTRYQIGLAAMVDVTVDDGPAEVEIDLPGRGSTRTLTVDVNGELWVGLSLQDGDRLEERISSETFRYA